LVALLGIISLSGCAALQPLGPDLTHGEKPMLIAVLPVENLSGGPAPVKEVRQGLADRLKELGLTIMPYDALESFMARHRLRNTGAIDGTTAMEFRNETGVAAVLITSLELYNESNPPRIALTSRIVTAEESPKIISMSSTAMAGNDAPGLFGLGLIENPRVLTDKAVERLAEALVHGDKRTRGGVTLPPEALFLPRPLDPTRTYSVAVLPFFNKSSRKYAGEIVALHFIRELNRLGNMHVIEPGVIRQELLRYRIIMEEGVSMADAEIVFGILKADLILSGNVDAYEDHQGSYDTPKVEFSALLLDRQSRKAVWAVNAHNTGDDRNYFFDVNRLTTASSLSAEMIRSAVESINK
jgi:TolB-like protein